MSSVPATATARITYPDDDVHTVTADNWGRVRIRPMQAGRYAVESAGATTQVLPTITTRPSPILCQSHRPKRPRPSAGAAARASDQSARQVQPLVFVLVALALLALMVESAMLIGHAGRWGMRHV